MLFVHFIKVVYVLKQIDTTKAPHYPNYDIDDIMER